jgi:hypothetical protein
LITRASSERPNESCRFPWDVPDGGAWSGSSPRTFLRAEEPEPWISREVARLTLGATSRPALKLLAIHLFPLGGLRCPREAVRTNEYPIKNLTYRSCPGSSLGSTHPQIASRLGPMLPRLSSPLLEHDVSIKHCFG